MRLIINGSSSTGNQYVLDSGNEILLLEAGIKMADVKKSIDFQLPKVVGCLATHIHSDHAKYITEYSKFGINIYGPKDIADKKQFPYGMYHVLKPEKTVRIGSFSVVPFHNFHDVEIYGYLIRHEDCGTILFSSDTYKLPYNIKDIDHWLIEANYDDRILKANIEDGRIDRAQANRLMLSHLSLDNTIHYLHMCEAEKSRTITLCHLSERNSCPKLFADRVAGEFGVPTQVADKGVIVELYKNEPI